MNPEPMFYQGQAVRCVNKSKTGSRGSNNPLIEGKKYYISNPDYTRDKDTVFVCVSGIEDKAFDQLGFVPEETNDQLEEAIFEALKGQPIVN